MAREAGLVPPLLAKPLWADGRNGAHELALLADEEGIQQLCRGDAPPGVALPVTLQQYVDHGACLFKARLCIWACCWHGGVQAVQHRRPSARCCEVILHVCVEAEPGLRCLTPRTDSTLRMSTAWSRVSTDLITGATLEASMRSKGTPPRASHLGSNTQHAGVCAGPHHCPGQAALAAGASGRCRCVGAPW